MSSAIEQENARNTVTPPQLPNARGNRDTKAPPPKQLKRPRPHTTPARSGFDREAHRIKTEKMAQSHREKELNFLGKDGGDTPPPPKKPRHGGRKKY